MGMSLIILEPDEKIEAVYASPVSQDRNKLSVLQKGVWTPISFDVLDYIACDHIASHRATIHDGYDDNFDFTCYYAKLQNPVEIDDDPEHMGILEPDEDIEAKYHAKGSQYRDHWSVLQLGEWTPISYDVLDYIACDHIASHRAMVTDKNTLGYDFSCYYASVPTLCDIKENDETGINILSADEKPEVFYHSSISQHRNKLSVVQAGEWVPISYDVLDYIACDHVASHPAMVTDGDDIGFNFSVSERHYYTDLYLISDRQGVELKPLPEWFGTGMYEEAINERVFTNADNGSVGNRTKNAVRVGTNYALAVTTLEPDDD